MRSTDISAHNSKFLISRVFVWLYVSLVFYYWVLISFYNPQWPIENYYWFFVIPSACLAFLGLGLILVNARINDSSFLLAIIISFVGAIAILRGDQSTAISITFLFSTILVVINFKPYINLNFVNFLFLLSVVLSAFTYYLGIKDYGFIPGQSLDSASQGLEWRVSLFPSLPESAFFSAFVLILNLNVRGLLFRYAIIVIAAYFLIFSGIRSAVLAFSLATLFHLLTSGFRLGSGVLLPKVYFLLCISLFFLIVFFPALLIVLGFDEYSWVRLYVFRTTDSQVSPEQLRETVYRSWLWLEHLRIWSENYTFGIGSFDFSKVVDDPLISGHQGTGSESFFTNLLARIGVFALFIVYIPLRNAIVSINNGSKLVPEIIILFIVAMFSYGSFFVSYNFLFLIFMLFVFGGNRSNINRIGI